MRRAYFLRYFFEAPRDLMTDLVWLLYPAPLRRLRFSDTHEYLLKASDAVVRFRTDDEYSQRWFFPRYAGGRQHEAAALQLFAELAKDSRCVVDVGTHLGIYACVAAAVSEESTVVGFEIDDRVARLAQANAELNGLSNVQFELSAVGSESSIARFRSSNRISPALAVDPGGDTTIRSVSLDDFFHGRDQSPDLIKIDVEGAELGVLEGMRKVIDSSLPTMLIEMHAHAWDEFNTSASAILNELKPYRDDIFMVARSTRGKRERLRRVASPRDLESRSMLLVLGNDRRLAALQC